MSKQTPLLRRIYLTGKRPADVARHLHLSPATVTNWTTARQKVPLYHVRGMAECLGIPMDDLLDAIEATFGERP